MKNNPLLPLLKQAAASLEQMDYGSAMALYRRALTLAPDNAGATMGMAMVYNRAGQPAEALKLLERLWKAATRAKGTAAVTFRAAVLAQLGLAQQQLGRLKQALAAFEEAHRLMPTEELAQRIAKIRPVASSPEPVQQLLLNARQLTAGGELEQAVKVYQAALQLHNDNVEALHGLAMLHRRRGSLDWALPLLQKAVILAPDRADLYNDMGMLFQDLGDLTKAVSFHKRALKVEPRFAPALINLGVAYKRQGKNDDAIAAYQAALAIAPNFAEAHNNLGNLLRVVGKLGLAKQHLEKALALKPGYADAKTNLTAVNEALKAKPVAKNKPDAKQPQARKAQAKKRRAARGAAGTAHSKGAAKRAARKKNRARR